MFHTASSRPQQHSLTTFILMGLYALTALLLLHTRAVQANDAIAPSESPTLDETIIRASAYKGETYGVGRIRVLFGEDVSSHWYPDQSIILTEESGRARFPTLRVETNPKEGKAENEIFELSAYFLFTDDEPLGPMSLTWSDREPIHVDSIAVTDDAALYKVVAQEWWASYSQNHNNFQGEQKIATESIQRVLGRRMGFPTHPINVNEENGAKTQLEAGFERIVRTLFGFDSVLLSMPEVQLQNSFSTAPAVHSAPRPMRLNSVRLPTFTPNEVEQIAKYVPTDCFYVRCPSVTDYLWLREMMTDWGGNLEDIIAVPTLDYGIRGKLERQLSLNLEAALEEGLEDSVGEVALIGHDLLFRDGPSLGVVLEARDETKLEQILANQRHLVTCQDFTIEKIKLANSDVIFASTADHTIRSFHATRGKYHLITNSRALAEKFLNLGQKSDSLAGLGEFQYARSKYPVQEDGRCFMYLSDPFFRHLADPLHRIELYRRARLLKLIQHATIAAMIAQRDGVNDITIDQLIANNYLPSGYQENLPDSELIWAETGFIDSLRGRRGTLLPASDMMIGKVTQDELNSYNTFSSRYRREWRIADPVIVALSTPKTYSSENQKISIDISVTPYARNRYASLRSLLGGPSNRRVGPIASDLLSINASIGHLENTRQIHLGIQDSPVPFTLEGGEIQTTGAFKNQTLLGRNLYGAVTPKGYDSLIKLRAFAEEFQLIDKQRTQNSEPAVTGAKWALYLLTGFNTKWLQKKSEPTFIDTWNDWSIFSRDRSVGKQISHELSVQGSQDPAQVWMHIANVQKSDANAYIQAYTFLDARKVSARNARFLDFIDQQLEQSAGGSLQLSESILGARVVCPLGGSYQPLHRDASTACWQSTAWQNSTYFEVDTVPDSYQFPFLQWLHEMDLRFQLDANTLHSNIELVVANSQFDGDKRESQEAVAALEKVTSRPIEPGDHVVVAKEGTELMIGSNVASRLSKGMKFRLLKFKNGWAGITQIVGQQKVEGWVRRDHLSLDQNP